jgi:hypothetical protein
MWGKIQIFWNISLCEVINVYLRFKGPYCLKLHRIFLNCLSLNMKASQSFEMSGRQAAIAQKTLISGKIALKNSNFAKWHCLSHNEMNYFSASRRFTIKYKYSDHNLKTVQIFNTFHQNISKFHISITITSRNKLNQTFCLGHFCMILKQSAYDPASDSTRCVGGAQRFKPY